MGKVIAVENISKAYQLGDFGTGTISRDLERFWARIRGKEDPFLKIGEVNDRTTKSDSDVVWSLKDLNFEIEQGDAVGIIGRNGAGKSTLLKILSRVTYPTTGSVKLKGRIASLLEVGTGFHPELSGRENIYLNGAILGMRKKEIARKFDEIVDFAGVERYIDTPVKRYSSGMYVRLAFAVAAHLESEILIVDEVLAVGDAEFQKKCLGKMGDVSKGEGRTVLFVSHNMDSIKTICNKGIVLNNGSIAFNGDVYDAVSTYSVVAGDEFCKTQLINYPLTNDVKVEVFEIDKAEITSGQDIAFRLSITCATGNSFQSIALFIYDQYDQKVSFIDLRCNNLFAISAANNSLTIEGTLQRIPYLPGKYKVGFHLQSNLVYHDFVNLLQFEVVQKDLTDNLMPYPLHVRGNIELDYTFNIHA